MTDRLKLYGLCYTCPYGFKDPCQLDDVRKMEFEERIDWVNSLTDEEVDEYIKNHQHCDCRKKYEQEKREKK